MSSENKEILFEKRDTQTRAIAILLVWMIVVCWLASLLMIPLTKYFWDITATPVNTLPATSTPEVVLEVFPNQELHKMKTEISESQDSEKINHAMQSMLEKGFPVKS